MASTAELQAEHGPNWRSLKPDCAQPERQGAAPSPHLGMITYAASAMLAIYDELRDYADNQPPPKPSPPHADIVAGLRALRDAMAGSAWDEAWPKAKPALDRAIDALGEKGRWIKWDYGPLPQEGLYPVARFDKQSQTYWVSHSHTGSFFNHRIRAYWSEKMPAAPVAVDL